MSAFAPPVEARVSATDPVPAPACGRCAGAAPAHPAVGAFEKWGLIVGFAVYAVFQLHAAVNHGNWGQDFGSHYECMQLAFEDPATFITSYQEGRTNPPLYHLLAAQMVRLVGPRWDHSTVPNGLVLLAIVSAALHGAGLLALHRVTRRVISSPVLRLACALFLLFLPFAMIHGMVIASDALATPLFLFAVALFARLADPLSPKQFATVTVGLSAVLVLNIATKFTAMSLVPAAALVLLALWRIGALTGRRLGAAAVLLVLLPGTFAFLEFRDYKRKQTYSLGLPKEMKMCDSGFSPRSFVWPYRADAELIKNAPPYDAKLADGHSIAVTIPYRYSYPALMHLGMFTDILNIYQYDPADSHFGARSPVNAMRMRWAVWTAVPFTLGVIAAVPAMLVLGAFGVIRRRDPHRSVILLMLSVLAGAFYLNIIVFLPFVDARGGGYWLPRLVAPALLCFFVLMFVVLDRLVGKWRGAAWLCLLYVIAQSVLQLSFLWPTPPDA